MPQILTRVRKGRLSEKSVSVSESGSAVSQLA
jgi:hypothetical protein